MLSGELTATDDEAVLKELEMLEQEVCSSSVPRRLSFLSFLFFLSVRILN